jgi:hypothetical protein
MIAAAVQWAECLFCHQQSESAAVELIENIATTVTTNFKRL